MEKLKELYFKYKEIVNYLIVGGLTTVVSLLVYFICVSTFCDPSSPLQLQAANVISWVVAVTFAFFTNRKYVFESSSENIWAEAGKFYVSRLSTLGIDMLIMFITVTVFGMNDKVAKLIVQVVVTITNYLLSKFLVFNKSSNS